MDSAQDFITPCRSQKCKITILAWRGRTNQARLRCLNLYSEPLRIHRYRPMSEPLTKASYNIQCLGRGLEGTCKRREIRDLFRNTQPQPDIVLLQKTVPIYDSSDKTDNWTFSKAQYYGTKAHTQLTRIATQE